MGYVHGLLVLVVRLGVGELDLCRNWAEAEMDLIRILYLGLHSLLFFMHRCCAYDKSKPKL